MPADRAESRKLVFQLRELPLVADERFVAVRHVAHVQSVGGQDEVPAKFVEAAQESERHRARQQLAQNGAVEVQMRRLTHVAQVFALLRVEPPGHAILRAVRRRQILERRVAERPPFFIQKLRPRECRRDEKRRHAPVLFRRRGELDAQSPRLHALPIWPRKLHRDVGDCVVAHVLGHAEFLLLRVAEAVSFQRAVAAVAGGGLIELHQPQIAHQHILNEVHEDGLPAARHARKQKVSLDRNAVAVAVPIQRVNARESDGAAHGASSSSGASSSFSSTAAR